MKYEGKKPFQIHREVSAIKATLIFETDDENALRRFMSSRQDLAGCIFRQFDPTKNEFTIRKLRVTRERRAQRKSRLAFRRG